MNKEILNKHPLPWKIATQNLSCYIVDANGKMVITKSLMYSLCELIVNAVNKSGEDMEIL